MESSKRVRKNTVSGVSPGSRPVMGSILASSGTIAATAGATSDAAVTPNDRSSLRRVLPGSAAHMRVEDAIAEDMPTDRLTEG